MALRRVVQLDRPAGACDRVGKVAARAHVLDGELLAADDPARLADAERPVGADARVAERRRIFAAQERDRAIRLILALERFRRHLDRIERRLDVRHVDQRDALAREHEGEAALARQAVVLGFLLEPRRDLRAVRLVRLVDPLDDDHLRAVDRPVGASRQASPAFQASAASPVASTNPAAATLTSP